MAGGKVLIDPVTYNGFVGLALMFNITLVPCPIDEDVVTSAAYNFSGNTDYNGIPVALGNVSNEKILIEGPTIIKESL